MNQMQTWAEQVRAELGDSLTQRQGSGNRAPGMVAGPTPVKQGKGKKKAKG